MKRQLLLLLTCMPLVSLMAQDFALPEEFKRISPQSPQPQQTKPKPKAVEPEVSTSEKILSKQLDAIVIFGSGKEVQKEGITDIAALDFPDKEHYDYYKERSVYPVSVEHPFQFSLPTILKKYVGKPLTQKDLDSIKRDIVMHYRLAMRPIVDVYVPQHAFTNNTLQIVVNESNLGEISVEGAVHFDSDLIKNKVRLNPGEPIDEKVIGDDLNWINSNPFRSAELLYEKGSKPDTTDVVISVTDKKPVRYFGGTDNLGNKLTGYQRFMAGVNWGNAFGKEHIANYQYTTSNKPKEIQSHSLSYAIPVDSLRHTLMFIGSYSDSGADFADPTLELDGNSWSLGVRYAMPLFKDDVSTSIVPASWLWAEFFNWTHNLTVGFDFKRSNNSLAANQLRLSDTYTDVVQAILSHNVMIPLDEAVFSLTTTYAFSPGDFTQYNNNEDFAAAGSGDANYQYLRMDANYVRPVFEDYTLVLKGQAQLASDNLSGGEKIGIGGSTTVRGYDEREGNGDFGYSLGAELRTPAYSIREYIDIPEKWGQDQLQLLVFAEYGNVTSKNPAAGTDRSVQLLGVGPGVRYSVGEYLTFSLDLGFQLKDSGVSTISRQAANKRIHAALNLSY